MSLVRDVRRADVIGADGGGLAPYRLADPAGVHRLLAHAAGSRRGLHAG